MTHSSDPQPPLALPPTESLVAALSALRQGSFSAAAGELAITHAAVSRRIAQVEEWAGERLFTRHGRGVRPTPNGQRILARIGVALDQIALLGRSAKVQGRLPGVRLAVTPSFARFWLLPRLALLEGDPADVRIEVIASQTHADLVGGEVDLAIRYGRGNWKIGDERKLFDEVLYPVVARSLHRQVAKIGVGDVARWPWLHDGDTSTWSAWAERYGAVSTQSGERILAGYALAIDAVLAGLGVTLWNSALHGPLDGLLAAELPVRNPLGYYLLSRRGDVDSPASRVAARVLAACAAREGGAGA